MLVTTQILYEKYLIFIFDYVCKNLYAHFKIMMPVFLFSFKRHFLYTVDICSLLIRVLQIFFSKSVAFFPRVINGIFHRAEFLNFNKIPKF